ncbi:MAG: gamma carbonic anhydrase family protein [Hyphomicrobiaceae bacterium]
MTLYSLDTFNVERPPSGNFWVAENATLLGRVRLEDDTSIWFNAVLRGDNEPIVVGQRSNVQDGCVLHTDPGFPMTIESDCTIGHMVMLHGCRVGRCSLVGIGSVILNGAVIGEESVIGAKALIPEGKIIPPRSVVMGVPGRIVREATDADIARNMAAVESYQRRWRWYASQMKAQS